MSAPLFKRAQRIVDRVLPELPFNGFNVSQAGMAHDWAAIDRQRDRRALYREVHARLQAKAERRAA